MKRRIIKQGHNTLTITLPSSWAKKFNVNAGEEVDILEQGKNLVIAPNGQSGPSEITIDISGLTIPVIWRYISSAYRAGHTTIKITFENKKLKDLYTAFTYNTLHLKQNENDLSPLEAIQALVNRFVGVEIIEHKSNYCIIQEISETSPKEFENALRRIFLLIQTLSQAAIDATTGNFEGVNAAHIIDTNIDRFDDFCLRVLNKSGYSDFEKTPTMYTILFLLELLGDEYKRLAIHMVKAKKISADVTKYIKLVDKMYSAYYHFYYSFSKEKIDEIWEFDKEGHMFFDEIEKKLDQEERDMIHHLKKIGKFIVSLTELRMDLEYI